MHGSHACGLAAPACTPPFSRIFGLRIGVTMSVGGVSAGWPEPKARARANLDRPRQTATKPESGKTAETAGRPLDRRPSQPASQQHTQPPAAWAPRGLQNQFYRLSSQPQIESHVNTSEAPCGPALAARNLQMGENSTSSIAVGCGSSATSPASVRAPRLRSSIRTLRNCRHAARCKVVPAEAAQDVEQAVLIRRRQNQLRDS
mmetsp:Transcript_22702/g.73493  ORF Transcript_22702/g.73493 Transcript_22702/m.73493 type:complete len:203 (-) Transcript_22702:544-1152(-)|eukprot:scaffold6397_cov121-Isochrysis_galbana.AAC.1